MASNRASNKLPFPGSLFKDRNGIYIYSLCVNYQRKQLSTQVRDYKLAVKVARKIYPNLFAELKYPTNPTIPFDQLVKKFFKYDHGYSERTISMYTQILKDYIYKGVLPDHPTTRSIWARTINRVINWGERQDIYTNHKKHPVDVLEPRARILTDLEIKIVKEQFVDCRLKDLCLTSLITGARQMELLHYIPDPSNDFDVYFIVTTKSKMVEKKRSILKFDAPIKNGWDVSRHQLNNYWMKSKKGLDIQFRDLRRTFAVKKYQAGYSLLDISKMMGHESVVTTEKYLKPFLVTMITAPAK